MGEDRGAGESSIRIHLNFVCKIGINCTFPTSIRSTEWSAILQRFIENVSFSLSTYIPNPAEKIPKYTKIPEII